MIEKIERIQLPSVMPFAHAPNVLRLPDSRIFVCWYTGSYEGAADQTIAACVMTDAGMETMPFVLVDRFTMAGETWIPEIGVPVLLPNGAVRLVLWACPISSFRLKNNSVVASRWGGAGGGSWFAYTHTRVAEAVWSRDIAASQLFAADLGGRWTVDALAPLDAGAGFVLMGAALRTSDGTYLLPYHHEATRRAGVFIGDSSADIWKLGGSFLASPGCYEPVIAQLQTGSIVCLARNAGFDGHIWVTSSSDQGRSFAPPTPTNLRNPNAGIDIAIDDTTDEIAVIFNDSYRLRTPLTVGLSTDHGRTFACRDLEADFGAFGYPKLLKGPDRTWHVFYSENYGSIVRTSVNSDWIAAGRIVPGARTGPWVDGSAIDNLHAGRRA